MADASRPARKAPPRIGTLLKLVVAVAVIWWLLASGRMDLRELANLKGRWHFVAIGVVAWGLVQVLTAWRWQILLHLQGFDYSARRVLTLAFIGLFFNQLVFGSTGGDVYRVYAVARDHPTRRSAAMVSVMVDRVTGLMMTLLLVPLALFSTWELVSGDDRIAALVWLVIGILLGSVLLTFLLFSARLRQIGLVRTVLGRAPMQARLKRIDAAVRTHFARPFVLAGVLLLGIVAQVLIVLTNVLLAFALIPDLDLIAPFFLLIPIALTAMALPINPPGAIGTGEALYQSLLGIAGIAHGSVLCLLQRAVQILWSLPGAILYIAHRPPTRRSATPGSCSGVQP